MKEVANEHICLGPGPRQQWGGLGGGGQREKNGTSVIGSTIKIKKIIELTLYGKLN